MTSSPGDALGEALARLLDGPRRAQLVEALIARGSTREALPALRKMMRGHVWTVRGRTFPLAGPVRLLDGATRAEGFHALNDWDGTIEQVNHETIPVDVLDFLGRVRPHGPPDPGLLAVLVDYYLFHLLSLLALRAWDSGDAPAALARLTGLLDALQGPDGSGHQFVADAETLLLVASSHYERNEAGFDVLLDRVAGLPDLQRRRVALGHAGCLGAHLRFGYLATYGRRHDAMREDNAADYPWLFWSVDVALDALAAYPARSPERRLWTGALLAGLTADTAAILDHVRLGPRLRMVLPDLVDDFEALAPTRDTYSPLAYCFNFSYNVVKGATVDAALRGEPWAVPFNDLLLDAAGGRTPQPSRLALARTLMEYGRRSPERIRGELLPVIVYDVDAGRECHASTMATLRAALP